MQCPGIPECLVILVGTVSLLASTALGGDGSADLNALRYDGKPFEYWRDYLRTELKAERRIDGLRALAAFGARGHARSAAAAIVEMVKEYGKDAYDGREDHLTLDQKVIQEAVMALGKIGPAGFEVVLRQARDANVRRFAQEVKGHSFADDNSKALSATAVRTLLRYIQGEDRELRSFAVVVLSNGIFGPSPSAEAARAVLRAEKNIEPLLRALIPLLEDDHTVGVEDILEVLGPRAKGATSTLVKLKLKDGYTRSGIFKALGAETKELIPNIAAGLESPEARVRETAAKWLGEIGPEARPTVPGLLRALREGPKTAGGIKRIQSRDLIYPTDASSTEEAKKACSIVDARCAMIASLVLIRAEPRTLVPVLAESVSSQEEAWASREEAARALEKLGARAREAAPALLEVFASAQEVQEVRSAALAALEQVGIDSGKVVPLLIKEIEIYLENHPKNNWLDDGFTAQLMRSLVRLRPQAGEALPLLLRAFKQFDHDNHFRPLLAQALGEMGPEARAALPALRAAAKSEEVELRKAAKAAAAENEGDGGPKGPKSK